MIKFRKVVTNSDEKYINNLMLIMCLRLGTLLKMRVHYKCFPVNFENFLRTIILHDTTQKIRLCIKDFFSKYDQIRNFLRIWSHLLKKSLMENLIFCTA